MHIPSPGIRAGLFTVAASLLSPAVVHADTPIRAARAAAPVRLSYRLKPGEKHHYKLVAFFNGHFPPFAEKGSDPIHIQAIIDYIATVNKTTARGTEVAFDVDTGVLRLLQNAPGADGKITGDPPIDYPIPLAQIQQWLNVTATFKPDGSVVDVSGGNASALRLNIGFDPRKLFLTMIPVVFPADPLAANVPWNFNDGLLGHGPGIAYTARLLSTTPASSSTLYAIGEQGHSAINTPLDKEGNSSKSAADAAGSLQGTITANGTVRFSARMSAPAAISTQAVLVRDADMLMDANLTRLLPDPDKPGVTKQTDIDVQAHVLVKELPMASGPTVKTARVTHKRNKGSH